MPRQFRPAVEKGVRQVLADGAIAGYPLTGVRVRALRRQVPRRGLQGNRLRHRGQEGLHRRRRTRPGPSSSSPTSSLEITAPAKYMGDIAGDLSTKRGRVQDTLMVGADTCLVRASAPLGELQNYSNELKSMTGGTGLLHHGLQPRRAHPATSSRPRSSPRTSPRPTRSSRSRFARRTP